MQSAPLLGLGFSPSFPLLDVCIQTATLRQELKILVAKRNQLEDAYTVFATEEVGMDQENVVANIKKARSAPQKNKRLQAIHEAHKAVVSKEAAIDKAAGQTVN